MALSYGVIIRLVSYGMMIPGAMALGMHLLNLGHRRRAALMFLYALAHGVALVTVVLRLMGLGELVGTVVFALTPIVLCQALLFVSLSASILKGTMRNGKGKAGSGK